MHDRTTTPMGSKFARKSKTCSNSDSKAPIDHVLEALMVPLSLGSRTESYLHLSQLSQFPCQNHLVKMVKTSSTKEGSSQFGQRSPMHYIFEVLIVPLSFGSPTVFLLSRSIT